MLPIYMTAVMLVTFAGGVGTGFAGAAFMVVLTYVVYPHPSDPLSGTPYAATRMWVMAVSLPTVILLVGFLQRRNLSLLNTVRLANRLLSESEQQYKSLFEYHPEAKAACDMLGKVFSVNEAFERLTGYSPEESMKLNISELVKPEERLQVRGGIRRAGNGRPAQYEVELRTKDGGRADVRITNVPIHVDGHVVGVYTLISDLTEMNRTSRQLMESEERYRLLAENSIDLITYLDPGMRVTYVSPSYKTLLGYEPAELIGINCPDYLTEDGAPTYISTSAETTPEDDRHWFVSRGHCKDGGFVWMETQRIRIRSECGEVKMIVCVSRDITRRVEAEEEIRRREESYRLLVEQFPDAIIISRGGRAHYVNHTAVTLFAAESKEQLIRDVDRLIHPESAAPLKNRIAEASQEKGADSSETKIVAFDGRVIDVELESLPMLFEGQPAIHTLIRDITASKQTQHMLQQAEKLNLIGQMAAGVAHEIRNPLTSLKGFVQLIQEGGGKPMYYDIMRSELDRIELIVRDLLMLAKPQAIRFERCDVRHILQHVLTLTESQALLAGVEVFFELPGRPLLVECEANQIKQVFLNLIQNAIEAMENVGGSIRITAKPESGMAVIQVRDTGPGIPAEMMKQLGQPFYTTKEKGTGLGLMVSFGIVKNHRGTIEADSRADAGTTFTVRLPLIPAEASEEAAAGRDRS